jgi:GNAT superfamily N-acetyltransferase
VEESALAQVVGVLCEAFHDYPVMRWVLGKDGDYEGRLRTLVGFFVQARVLRSEPILMEPESGRASAAALVSFPGRVTSPASMDDLRDAVWRELGPGPRGRYAAFGEACLPLSAPVPQVHLNMVGVSAAARGTGAARRLIERVHALSAAEEWSQGVGLTTEDPANVPLYQHLGYTIVGHARVSSHLETWAFFRPDAE